MLLSGIFDVILNLEIVEHVENVNFYINSCYKLLKNKGLMFTATLNRTFTSYIKAIIGAEYILRWLPIGTHDWNKFIKPEELEKTLSQQKFLTVDIRGMKFNPFSKKWKLSMFHVFFSQTITFLIRINVGISTHHFFDIVSSFQLWDFFMLED